MALIPTKTLTTRFTIYIISHDKPLLGFAFPGSYFCDESSILSNATITRLERREWLSQLRQPRVASWSERSGESPVRMCPPSWRTLTISSSQTCIAGSMQAVDAHQQLISYSFRQQNKLLALVGADTNNDWRHKFERNFILKSILRNKLHLWGGHSVFNWSDVNIEITISTIIGTCNFSVRAVSVRPATTVKGCGVAANEGMWEIL